MRVLSFTWKPISSPNRTDKFPPPLMRFLRTKSKAKSRSKYPLFLRRNNKKAITNSSSSSSPPFTIEPTQEPSSPKVTCIGQVRVRRSKSKPKPKPEPEPPSGREPSSCSCCFGGKPIRFPSCKPDCRKWVSLFCNCRRSVRVRTDSSKFGSSRFEHEKDEISGGGTNEEVMRQKWRSMSYCMEDELTPPPSTVPPPPSTVTPPKNALLLTRCRSAPYRSSSLACQFWGSPPLKDREQENEDEQNDSALGMERSRDSTASSRRDQDSGRTSTSDNNNSNSNSNNNSNNNSQKDHLGVCTRVDYCLDREITNGESEEDSGVIERPVLLMRSKSEPTRRDLDRIDPQSSEFWRQRRLSNTQS